MDEKQPLLETTENTSSPNNVFHGGRKIINKCLSYHDWFGPKQTIEDDKSDGDNQENINKWSYVKFMDIFRFVDRTDIFIICIGCLAMILQTVNYIASMIFFGKLTGSFAEFLFIQSYNKQVNLSMIMKNITGCPPDIAHTSFNYDPLYKIHCRYINTTSSLLGSTLSHIQANAVQMIHWFLITTGVQIISTLLAYLCFSVAGKRQTTRITTALFRSITQRSVSYFDVAEIGQLGSKLFDNTDIISRGIGYDLAVMLDMILCAIVSLIVIFIINWKLSLSMIWIVPLMLGGCHIFTKLISRETTKELKTYSKAGQIAMEVFTCLRTVLSHNGAKFEKKRYENELATTKWSSVKKGALSGIFHGWGFLIINIVYSCGVIFGLMLMNSNGYRVGIINDTVVIIVLIAQGITFPNLIGIILETLSDVQAAATEVFQVIDEKLEPDMIEAEVWDENESNNEPITLKKELVFENVSFTYPARPNVLVLDGISLVIRAGETTAIVGSSGCGKSTCMSLLVRFYKPSSGTITVDDRPINEYNLVQLRKHIGVVSQEPNLFATSIYENIRYGKEDATRAEIEQVAKEVNAHDFISQLPHKYDTLVGDRGIQLSGGEKQRIALARALIKQPCLLLLDEGTSALDNTNETIVQEALTRACKGRTAIIIAHRLKTIQNADNIYVLDKGKVIEQGTHKTLMAKEIGQYKDMFNSQEREQEQCNMNKIMTQEVTNKVHKN